MRLLTRVKGETGRGRGVFQRAKRLPLKYLAKNSGREWKNPIGALTINEFFRRLCTLVVSVEWNSGWLDRCWRGVSSIRFMIGWQSKLVVLEIERSFDVEIKIFIKPEIFIRDLNILFYRLWLFEIQLCIYEFLPK